MIIAPYPAMSIAAAEIASGKIGEDFSASLSASAIVNGEETSIAPVWNLVGGALPAGLALSSDGVISGVPEESGAFDFAVQASAEVTTVDGHNIALSADKNFTLLIANAAGELPHDVDIVSCEVSFSGSSELTLTEGTSGRVTLTPEVTAAYSDGSARLLAADEYSASWTINSAFLAACGMNFSNGTLTVSETTPADTYNIAVSIEISVDGMTAAESRYFNVTVNPQEGHSATSNENFAVKVDGDSVVLTVNNDSGRPVESFADIVNNLSQLKKELITAVDLQTNPTITSLTGINELKNLTSLNASGCESLSEVDVSGCDKLEYLDVSSCDIGSLSVEGCEALRELVCSNNSIETLDLSSCPNFEVLDCKNNNLSVLNFEANNLLTKIDCRYNGLPALDITESIFAALNELRCEGQQIFGVEADYSGGVYRIDDINALSGITENISGVLAGAATLDKVYNVKAYDENGQEIQVTYDSGTGVFESPSKPDTVKYDYVTGYRGVDMDVTLKAAYSPEVLGGTLGSRGGCDASFGCLALLSLVLLLRKR